MPSDNRRDGGEDSPETVQRVGQLVKYSREINGSDTVDEVGTYALEATMHVMDSLRPTVVEIHRGDLAVLASTSSDTEAGSEPGEIARRAYETGTTVVFAGNGVELTEATAGTTVLDQADLEGAAPDTGVVIAAPSVQADATGDVGVVLRAEWPTLERVREEHVKPLTYLADHVSTAIHNIRTQERLERARTDLAKRKEMVEVYDSLLRHDLGNDLQVITGFSEAVTSNVEDEETGEYARKIQQTARSAADLIDRVGDLVTTLERGGEPEVRPLEPILTDVVDVVDSQFESLTVEFEASAFDCQVFAGDLLDSIFTNVLSNAAVHNDGSVTVEVYAEEPTPGSVVVGFADDGVGVPPTVRDDIFEMGVKGPESDGTGLGLGLARALTESYGGQIDLRESESGGADVRVRLDRV
jgi:signal transduction histidine kinase